MAASNDRNRRLGTAYRRRETFTPPAGDVMVSRQTKYNHQRSVEALRERAAAAPIVVGYDAEIEKFVVRWTEDPDTVLIAARHEVVAAYIDGFVRAWINRPA
jgi:hypothetical protein